MRIVNTAYFPVTGFSDPDRWLDRIDFYTCILEALARKAEVHSIEHIGLEKTRTRAGVQYHFRPMDNIARRLPVSDHRFIRRLQPDAVLVNGVSVPLQVLQLRATLGKRPRILLWHRDEKPGTGWRGRLQTIADRAVDGYLFTSPGNAAPWIERGIISGHKVHYQLHASSVFLPGDRQTARAALGIPAGPLYLWVGRLDANKDPLTVLEAFGQLRRQRPEARLAMAFGGAPLERIVREKINTDASLTEAVL
ncbi:MAG: hypothetical protein EOP50_11010, partial [Sphingobacteriales bacterium]